jgi:hypothetical protein
MKTSDVDWRPSTRPPEGSLSVNWIVSLSSFPGLFRIAMGNVFEVSPAVKVRVPDAAV